MKYSQFHLKMIYSAQEVMYSDATFCSRLSRSFVMGTMQEAHKQLKLESKVAMLNVIFMVSQILDLKKKKEDPLETPVVMFRSTSTATVKIIFYVQAELQIRNKHTGKWVPC